MKVKYLPPEQYAAFEALYDDKVKAQRDLDNYRQKCRNNLINDPLAVKLKKQSFFKDQIKAIQTKIDELTR